MRAAILTDRQWIFLENFAASHRTTLDAIARHLIGAAMTAPKAARTTSGKLDRNASGKLDRKLTQDRARCAAAIGILERFLANPREPKYSREADQLEIERLQHALDNPALLWSIYRRADKGTAYTLPAPAPVASPVRKAV